MSLSTPPAQLWIGNPHELEQKALQFLQKRWCITACGVCINCSALAKKQHQGLLWIKPEKNYTLETIAPIFETICFARSADEPFFFVLSDSDMLSNLCANSLLKSIEEPPVGYHFILLAQRKEMILPTIRSRCHITEYHQSALLSHDSFLFSHFASGPQLEPLPFLQQLEKSGVSELESSTIMEAVLSYWIDVYSAAVQTNQETKMVHAEKKIALFKQTIELLPMPGSSKIFWKNLFLMNCHIL